MKVSEILEYSKPVLAGAGEWQLQQQLTLTVALVLSYLPASL